MPQEARRETAIAIRQMFGKTNVTQAKGVHKVIQTVHKYGFWTTILDTCQYIAGTARVASVSALTITSIYIFLNVARQYTTPGTILRREVDRYIGYYRIIHPPLREAVNEDSIIGSIADGTRRFGRGFRRILERSTFGLSELAIDGIEWALSKVMGEADVDLQPTLQNVQNAIDNRAAALAAVEAAANGDSYLLSAIH